MAVLPTLSQYHHRKCPRSFQYSKKVQAAAKWHPIRTVKCWPHGPMYNVQSTYSGTHSPVAGVTGPAPTATHRTDNPRCLNLSVQYRHILQVSQSRRLAARPSPPGWRGAGGFPVIMDDYFVQSERASGRTMCKSLSLTDDKANAAEGILLSCLKNLYTTRKERAKNWNQAISKEEEKKANKGRRRKKSLILLYPPQQFLQHIVEK